MVLTAQLASEWHAWHDARAADLATRFGQLSITDIQWVQPGQSGRWFDLPGEFSFDGTWMHFKVDPGHSVGPTAASLEVTDAPSSSLLAARHTAEGTFSARVSLNTGFNWLLSGDVVVELLNREGYVALRKRDSKAPLLSRFIDVPTFPLDKSWTVQGTFEAFDQPQSHRVGTATPGLDRTETFPGTVTFELGGQQHTLLASGSLSSGLYINFYDYTNGTTTPNWRRLDLGVPDQSGGVILDFNRTLVWPMAFTPYVACPAPVPQNLLPLKVEAGERKPAQTLGESGVNTPVLLVRTGGEIFYEKSLELLRHLGVDVTVADSTGGELLPPLTGYAGLVVVGYDTPEVTGVNEQVMELLSDATGASVPVVAIGNVATLLSSQEKVAEHPWQAALESTDFSVARFDSEQQVSAGPVYDVTVNDVVARDRLFSQVVRYDEGGTSYIPVREIEPVLRKQHTRKKAEAKGTGSTEPLTSATLEGQVATNQGAEHQGSEPQWSTHATWQDLIERFARLVHSQI